MSSHRKADYGELLCALREVLGLDPCRDIWIRMPKPKPKKTPKKETA